jgi:hypothetical protein
LRVREGEASDRFHVIVSGLVRVTQVIATRRLTV